MENQVDKNSMVTLIDLPDLVLVKIFSHLDIQELLKTVSVTHTRFNEIVKKTSCLWKHFSFDHPLELTLTNFRNILDHSSAFLEFLIPGVTLHLGSSEIDFELVTKLSNAKNLYWLDLTGCRLSTLCFLPMLCNLEILNVSECTNLVNEDFEIISKLANLDHLYVSFTNIRPDTIAFVCESLTLSVLDISGIKLNIEQCVRILQPDLAYLHLSVESQEDEIWLKGFVSRHYESLSVNIYRF